MSLRVRTYVRAVFISAAAMVAGSVGPAYGQLIDNTQATNTINAGINKSLADEIGAGRGDAMTPDSSLYIIARDPFRAVRRGRQLFQRKFTREQGQGPAVGDGQGNLNTNVAIAAGLADSCGGCHGRPRGAAGFGGDVATRPDSRDAPHLFGLGLREMLADEITADLRAIQKQALQQALAFRRSITLNLVSKGISFGSITAHADGSIDTSRVQGVNPDLPSGPSSPRAGRSRFVNSWSGRSTPRWVCRPRIRISLTPVPGTSSRLRPAWCWTVRVTRSKPRPIS